MSNKIKKVINTKPFYFILGALIFGTIGVSAATYFPSNDVTYDNKESGLESTNVQGAIDELYSTCKIPDQLNGTPLEDVPIVTEGDVLYKDEYEYGKYIFKGANPNNYITFNNEKAGWRIISIEYDGRIKIMKITSIGNMQWNDSISNDWATSDLNIYLNKTYYNQLNTEAKNQIIFSGFSIGTVEYLNNDMSTLISNENSIIRSSNIALPTVSEYIRTNSNKNNCGTIRLFNNNYSSCGSTGWMDNNNDWWTITPVYDSPSDIYSISSNDAIERWNVVYNYFVFPTIYLSSDTEITGGTGTKSDPYTIE